MRDRFPVRANARTLRRQEAPRWYIARCMRQRRRAERREARRAADPAAWWDEMDLCAWAVEALDAVWRADVDLLDLEDELEDGDEARPWPTCFTFQPEGGRPELLRAGSVRISLREHRRAAKLPRLPAPAPLRCTFLRRGDEVVHDRVGVGTVEHAGWFVRVRFSFGRKVYTPEQAAALLDITDRQLRLARPLQRAA